MAKEINLSYLLEVGEMLKQKEENSTSDVAKIILEFAHAFNDEVKQNLVSLLKSDPSLPLKESLLMALGLERNKFTSSNKVSMQNIIDVLVAIEAYPKTTPTMEKMKYTHLTMVEGWGENCFEWKGTLECPHCKADLRNHESGPPFKREMGMEVKGFYDGVAYFKCPDCGGNFSRQGTPLHDNYPLRRNEIFTV